jgi:hypothetical protein
MPVLQALSRSLLPLWQQRAHSGRVGRLNIIRLHVLPRPSLDAISFSLLEFVQQQYRPTGVTRSPDARVSQGEAGESPALSRNCKSAVTDKPGYPPLFVPKPSLERGAETWFVPLNKTLGVSGGLLM